VLAGYAGSSYLHLGGQQLEKNGVIGFAIDLSEEKIDVHMDVLGIYYDGLAPADKKIFTDSVEEAIATKGVLDNTLTPKAVTVRPETIKSTDADLATKTPTRTEFQVRILVPTELTARALQDRLLEKGDLLKKIKEELLDNNIKPETNIVVHSAPMVDSKREFAVVDDDHEPLIILDTDIRGIYYNKLSASPDLKAKFVEAVQGGIVANTQGLDGKSIGLDVSDAGQNAGLPFVHVTAKIPVPAGLSADATMSKWPKGSPQIGIEIQKRLKDLGGCFEQVTRDAGKGPHEIDVFPSALHLGAVRTTYAIHLKVDVDVRQLNHDGVGDHPTRDIISKRIKDSLKKMAQVSSNDISITEVTGERDKPVNPYLRFKAEIRAHGTFATTATIADWEQKALPVGRELQKYFKQNYLSSIAVDDDYVIMVGIQEVVNDIDTVDVDLVVHGIDYKDLSVERKKAFLNLFVKALRDGLVAGTGGDAYITGKRDETRVTVSPRDSDNALNVRFQIPAPDTPTEVHNLVTLLERNVLVGDKPNLQTHIKSEIEKMAGIQFLSTWTPHAIHVSVPGKVGINDFAGDVAGHMDKITDQFDKA